MKQLDASNGQQQKKSPWSEVPGSERICRADNAALDAKIAAVRKAGLDKATQDAVIAALAAQFGAIRAKTAVVRHRDEGVADCMRVTLGKTQLCHSLSTWRSLIEVAEFVRASLDAAQAE